MDFNPLHVTPAASRIDGVVFRRSRPHTLRPKHTRSPTLTRAIVGPFNGHSVCARRQGSASAVKPLDWN